MINKTTVPLHLTDEFRHALDCLENTTENLFITGRAGTGKSTLLQYFFQNRSKNMAVLAPTGVAAVNVGGQTIHSFFGFKPDITPERVKPLTGARQKVYKKVEAIIIDEISMVRADLLDAVARFLELNGREKLPFGGVQMIFFGDLYQLPPVVHRDEEEAFLSHYESPYFFSAKSFEALSLTWIELTRVFRQEDAEFLDLLNRIRDKTVSEADLDRINQRVQDSPEADNRWSKNPSTYRPADRLSPIVLTSTNARAEIINREQLHQLRGKLYRFEATIEGDFEKMSFPTAAVLELKEKARVMLLNNESHGRWVNGTLATIQRIHEKKEVLSVILPNGTTEEVAPHRWEMFRFEVDPTSQRLKPVSLGTFTQFPVRLAWAITIHKSQGLTFDQAIIDLSHKTFAHGQLYVAMSRLRTLEGLVLTRPIRREDIWLDDRIQRFITGSLPFPA